MSGTATQINGVTAEKVVILDGSGAQITSFGGGTQYTDAAAAPAHPVGNTIIYNNAGTMTAISDTNPLPVSATINTAGLATSAKQDTQITAEQAIQTSVELIDDAIKADDAAFTPATTKVMMAGFEFDDTSPDSVDEGDAGAARMSSRREVYMQIRDAAGNERGVNVNASNQLAVAGPVTNAGTFVVQENGSALTALQLIDDGVFTDDTSTHSTGSTKGYGIMAVATPTDAAVDANDIGMVAMTTSRQLKVDASGVAVPVTDNSGSLTVDAPVGTPVFVRLSDGSSAISTLPVSLASVPSHAVTNAGTFAVQDSEKLADNAGFTDGTTKVMPTGYIYDEVAGTALTENDIAAARINVNRAQVSTIEDGTTRGRYATVTASNALKVDASGVAVPVTDNSSSLSVDWNGTQPVTGSGNATGALRVELANNGTGLISTVSTVTTVSTLSNTTQLTPGTAASNLGKAEDAGHTTGDTGVGALFVRNDTLTAQTNTDADYGFPAIGSAGEVVVSHAPITGYVSGKTSTTGTTVQSILSAPGASTYLYVTDVDLSNTGSTTSLVTMQYDTAGTPTDLYYFIVPAGGGYTKKFGTPIKVPTANKDVGLKAASASTTIYMSMSGFKSKV